MTPDPCPTDGTASSKICRAHHHSNFAPAESKRLKHDVYQSPTELLAEKLLGTRIVRILPDGQRLSGIVVETEAYLARSDEASHSARGQTRSNASMFLPCGHLYVYTIHAKHCLNVVALSAGLGAAVLIRAIEPEEGLLAMQIHRKMRIDDSMRSGTGADQLSLSIRKSLTSGPGRLCQALAVDQSFDAIDLRTSPTLWLEAMSAESELGCIATKAIKRSTRIGISKSAELPLRFFFDGNHFVSGLARDHSQGRYWSFGDL